MRSCEKKSLIMFSVVLEELSNDPDDVTVMSPGSSWFGLEN